MKCFLCSKVIKEPIYCDSCEDHIFCSEQCAQIKAIEDDLPDTCPGVYWCGICSKNYLEAAKGHCFNKLENRAYHSDLVKYIGTQFHDGGFVDRCSKCGIYSYEFKSSTSELGKYEGISCEEVRKISMIKSSM